MRLYFWLLNGKCQYLAIKMHLFCKFCFWWNRRGWRKTCSAKFPLKSTSHTAFFVDHNTSWWFTTKFMWGQSLSTNPAAQIKSIQSNAWLTPHMRSVSVFINTTILKIMLRLTAQCRANELFSCLSHIKYLAISFCSSSHSPKQEQIVSFSFRVGCHQDRPLPAGKEWIKTEIRQRTTFTQTSETFSSLM